MARTILCDAPGCGAVADYMQSVIATGQTTGFCTLHYGVWAAMFVQTLAGDEPNADRAAAAVGATPGPSTDETGAEAVDVYTCGMCGVVFHSAETIEQHIRDVHPDLLGGEADEIGTPERFADVLP